MKKIIVTIFSLFALTGCGQNNAQEDYDRCNEEYAEGTECTEEEFREFLVTDAEEVAGGMGIDEMTGDTQSKVLEEIDEKVAEIFE